MNTKKPAPLKIAYSDLVEIEVSINNIPDITSHITDKVFQLDLDYVPSIYDHLESDIWEVVSNPTLSISLEKTNNYWKDETLVLVVSCPSNRVKSSQRWISKAIASYLKKKVAEVEKKVAEIEAMSLEGK